MVSCRFSPTIAALLTVLTICAPTAALAECVIYSQAQYAGQFRVLEANENLPVMGPRWDNRTSAVELSSQCRLVAFEDDNFEGDRLTFRRSTSRVDGPLSQRISSAQCQCTENDADGRIDGRASQPAAGDAPQRAVGRDDGPQRDSFETARREPAPARSGRSANEREAAPADTCMLYTGRNLQGAAVPIGQDRQRSTIPQPLTNDISSLSVPTGCVMRVFDEGRLEGQSTDFATGIYNTLGVTLDNRIGSAQCLCSQEAQQAAATRPATDGASRSDAEVPNLEPLEPLRRDSRAVTDRTESMDRRGRIDRRQEGGRMTRRDEPRRSGRRGEGRGERRRQNRRENRRESRDERRARRLERDRSALPRSDGSLRDSVRRSAQAPACALYTAPRQSGDVLELDDGAERDLRGPGVSRRVIALVSRMRSIGLRNGCTVSILDQRGDEFVVRSDRNRIAPRLARSAVKASCACTQSSALQRQDADRSRQMTDRQTEAPSSENRRTELGRTGSRQSDFDQMGGDDRELLDDRAQSTELPRGGRTENRSDQTVGSVLGLDDQDNRRSRSNATEEVASAPGSVPARSCAIYERAGYEGDRLVIEDGAAFSYLGGRLNDRVSSVQVAENCALDLYENREFNRRSPGFKAMFNRNQSSLRQGVADAASSAICRCAAENDLRDGRVRRSDAGDTQSQEAGGDAPMTLASQGDDDTQNDASAPVMAPAATDELPRVAQCVLFEHAGLRGEKLSLAPNTAFRWIGSEWSDRVSSATVSIGCELTLYRERDYEGGNERALNAGTFAGLGRWNDRTRSAKCACTRPSRDG